MIRLTIPSIEADDLEAVRAVLESGYLVQGPRVAAMEDQLAAYLGTKHVVAVSSGTAALHLALLALGVGRGDLVVTTTYSWPATANVIELCGARPVFVDIEPDTFNLSPGRLEETLAELAGKPGTAGKVKAILPVHAFGQLADMPRILELAGRYGLPVVEDAACALGATWLGRPAGTWGIMGCFSLHPRKAITTGEGGFISTADADLARRLRTLRNHGLDPQAPAPDFVEPGFNYRMTEFQAALGSTQLAKLDRILAAIQAFTYSIMASTYYRHYVESLGVERALDRATAEVRRSMATEIEGWMMPGVWPTIRVDDREVIEKLLAEKGLVRYGKIGSATLRCVRVQPMVDNWIAIVESDPKRWFPEKFQEWLAQLEQGDK
jgi:dTDP-4-amino-4,6-dideoxygalactose transaminase